MLVARAPSRFGAEACRAPALSRSAVARADVCAALQGDANYGNDYEGQLYADGQRWLNRNHIMGRVVGCVPHAAPCSPHDAPSNWGAC